MNDELTCVILVGGLGLRLRPAVADSPKSMAPIKGRPFLEYLLEQVRSARFTDLVLCVGHRAEVIEDHFADGRRFGLRIRYSREQQLLGTAGALSRAGHLIRSDPFLAMNGDSYCDIEFGALLSRHRLQGASATMVATWADDRSRCGSVVLGPRDTVVGFSEKEEVNGPGYVNAGIYVLNRAILDLIPAGIPCSIEREIFPSLVGRGLYAFKASGVFIDIGTPSELQRAEAVLCGQRSGG